MFTKFYLTFGIIVILLYGVVALTGREFSDTTRENLPADARQAPGGYRSLHFWHFGYRGGK